MRIAIMLLAVVLLGACSSEPLAPPVQPPPAKLSRAPADILAPPPASASVQTRAAAPTLGALVASFAVGDAIVVDERLVVLEPSLLVVTGRSMLDASTVWRTPFQPKAEGLHLLQRLGAERVLVRTGTGLTVLAAADGSTVAKHVRDMHDRTFVWERNGACGLRGQCSMQLIDCESAAPIGEPLTADHSKMKRWVGPDGDGHDPMPCFGFEVDLVGRSDDVVVYLTKMVRGFGNDRSFGVDARTGDLVWRSRDYGCGSCGELERGMSPDGKTCWVADYDKLQVFDCRTGKRRFERTVSELELAVWAGAESGGIFMSDEKVGILLDPTSGRPRWKHPAEAGTLSLPADAKLSDLSDVALRAKKRAALALLDSATGRETSRIPMTVHSVVVNASDGRIVVRDGATERDHTGQAIPSPGAAALSVLRERRPGTGTGPPNEAVVETPGGVLVDRIDADAWSLGQVQVGDESYVAVMVAREPREVRIYRVPR